MNYTKKKSIWYHFKHFILFFIQFFTTMKHICMFLYGFSYVNKIISKGLKCNLKEFIKWEFVFCEGCFNFKVDKRITSFIYLRQTT